MSLILDLLSQALPDAHLYCQPPGTTQAYLKGWKVSLHRGFGKGTRNKAELLEVGGNEVGGNDPNEDLTLAHDDDLAGWLSFIVSTYKLDQVGPPLIEGHARTTALTDLPLTQQVLWDALRKDEPLSIRDKESRLFLRAERGSNVLTLTDYYGGTAGPAIWTIAFIRPVPREDDDHPEVVKTMGLVQNGLRAKAKDLERHLEFLAGLVA